MVAEIRASDSEVDMNVPVDVVLTHGYFLAEDEKEQLIMRPYPPLGLMYLSSFLKENGYRVELFDSTFGSRGGLLETLRKNRGAILGVYVNFLTRKSVLSIVRDARALGMTVVVGGPDPANYLAEYLNGGVDYVVRGEGEETLCCLVAAILDKKTVIAGIEGISYLDERGELVSTPARRLRPDISSFPWPDREFPGYQRYFEVWRQAHGVTSASMITARGCSFRCTWCSHAVFGYSHRRRSVDDCVAELESIVKTSNPDQIWYADDVFTVNKKWLLQYAAALKKRALRVPFETISRADCLVDDQVVACLGEMGCSRIWIGAESGSQRLLDSMQRNVTVEQIFQATRKLQAQGIRVGMFVMWGYGDEDIEDIVETARQIARVNPDIYFTTIAHPIKGSPYFVEYEKEITLHGKWGESSDRDLRLARLRSRRFYRYASKYLKCHVEMQRRTDVDSTEFGRMKRRAERFRKLLEASADERME